MVGVVSTSGCVVAIGCASVVVAPVLTLVSAKSSILLRSRMSCLACSVDSVICFGSLSFKSVMAYVLGLSNKHSVAR